MTASTAFVTAAPVLKASPALPSSRAPNTCAPRASAQDVVDRYFPPSRRDRAPTIEVTDVYVSLSMAPVAAFTTADKDAPLLLDYSDPNEFVPSKPTAPSAISWPSGDGRSNEFKGVASDFDQPNLKLYGPFPDFYKVSSTLYRHCDAFLPFVTVRLVRSRVRVCVRTFSFH